MHRGMDIKSICFSRIGNKETPMFQHQALFSKIREQQVTVEGDTMRRENTGTHRNREIPSVWQHR